MAECQNSWRKREWRKRGRGVMWRSEGHLSMEERAYVYSTASILGRGRRASHTVLHFTLWSTCWKFPPHIPLFYSPDTTVPRDNSGLLSHSLLLIFQRRGCDLSTSLKIASSAQKNWYLWYLNKSFSYLLNQDIPQREEKHRTWLTECDLEKRRPGGFVNVWVWVCVCVCTPGQGSRCVCFGSSEVQRWGIRHNTGCMFKHKHSGTTGTFHEGENYLQGSSCVLN